MYIGLASRGDQPFMKRGKFHSIAKPIEEISLELREPLMWSICDATSERVTDDIIDRVEARHIDKQDLLMQLSWTSNYVLNELLENAYKFRAGGPIRVKVEIGAKAVCFFVQHAIDSDRQKSLLRFIDTLEAHKKQALYLQTLIQNSENPDKKTSKLGFLSMICDYNIVLGWEILTDSQPPQLITKARYNL
ncbi:MAG: hypothetical protein A2Y14_01010 [Verrucomicrobia bacterium GWF2_51_19]|nr:MAG: hypothetical protein A2Y14_01010 [Verrucomicrobia bacterium GWF2_51_19]HCJ12062.1 hypothetical protein [Opitutae bacterium]